MAIETQAGAYEKKRDDAKARLIKIRALIRTGDFGDAFVSTVTGLGDLIEDACTTGETMKFLPVTKEDTLRLIGIVKLEHIDELVTIAGMPDKLRKATYHECSPEFKNAFPDPKTIKASQTTKPVRRQVPTDGSAAPAILVPETRRAPRRIRRDRRPHNC